MQAHATVHIYIAQNVHTHAMHSIGFVKKIKSDMPSVIFLVHKPDFGGVTAICIPGVGVLLKFGAACQLQQLTSM